MRCALRVAAAGLFIVGVRLGHKFGKRRVHLHVVRHEQSAVAQARPKLAKLPEHVPVTMRAVVKKHVDRRRELIALEEIFHFSAHRHETG